MSRSRLGQARTAMLSSLAAGGMMWGGVRVTAELTGGAPDAMAMPPGDTTYVFGPVQKAGTTSGANYIESFTAPAGPGLYTLRIVNGNADGTNRATRVTARLNGALIVGSSDLNSGTAQVSKIVAVTPVDTLRLTVRGPAGSFVIASVFSTPDPSYNLFGPNQYAIPSGTSKTHTASFTRPEAAAGPFRLYIVNGGADGTQRVSSFTVSITSPGNSASVAGAGVGSIVKDIPLGIGTNSVSVQLSGPTQSFVTVRVTATDTTTPLLTITAPPPGTVTRDTAIEVTGTIQSPTGATVSVNGIAAAVTGTSYTATVPLPAEGSNLLTVSAVSAAGTQVDSTRTVIRDSESPNLALSSPADGSATNTATTTVTGTVIDATPVTVNTNGTPWTVGAGGAFGGTFPLADGPNVLTTTALDAAGNMTVIARTVTRDETPPALTVDAPAEGATVTAENVTVSGTVTDLTPVTLTVNGTGVTVGAAGAFSTSVPLTEGPNMLTIVATDAATNQTTVTRNVTRQTSDPLPPDPESVAPPLSPLVASTIGSATSFLYTGPDAIQTGVAPGTITPVRAAVIRGQVLSQSGAALPGVTIKVLDHPEYGQTLSRTDGRFDLATNGGGTLVIDYSKSGYLPSQRQVDLPWQDYVEIDSVAMLPLDPAVTTVNFSQPIEVAQGTPATDTSGTRRNTLLFEGGTEVSVTLPNGSSQPIIGPINVRSTEYTVGPLGPAAMPAVLPPTSAYTYAVELSVDEAMALGATEVQFSKPVASYVENFMNLPVGHAIPVGSYDRKQAKWIPEPDGRIIKILSVTGGMADLVVDTSGQVASSGQLTSLGITDAERQTLATTYPVNQTLWRTEHTHFSPKDYNLVFWMAANARGPKDPKLKQPKPPKNPNCRRGSIIYCESQVLGEVLSVSGTPFSLNYVSDRVPGYTAESSIELQVGEEELPPVSTNLESLELSVSVAGQHTSRSFSPAADLWDTYSWNGLDGYGRPVQGSQPVTIERCYRYKPVAVTRIGSDLVTNSFGQSIAFPGGGSAQVEARPFSNSSLCHTWKGRIGAWSARGQGFGGWNLSVAHSYDAGARTLYLGTGEKRLADAIGNILVTAAGTGVAGYTGDGGPATAARIDGPNRVLVGPDGSVYISGGGRPRVNRISPDGIITTFAGTGTICNVTTDPTCGEGQPATSAPLRNPSGMALGPDGSLYIADQNNARVRRVTPAGIMTTVAGTGTAGYNGDGIPATTARLNQPVDVALGPDGSLYIADLADFRVRKVSPDGLISTVAGNGTNCFFGGENGPATSTCTPVPTAVAVAPDGTLYISVAAHHRIRKVNQAGIITTVAGSVIGYAGDGGPAAQARFNGLQGLTIGPDGSLYIADENNFRLRKIDNAGIIFTVAGNGLRACAPRVVTTNCVTPNGDGGPATQASLVGPQGVAVGPDGTLYIAEPGSDRLRRISPALPGVPATDMLIASEGGGEVYRFDLAGRHLQTLDAKTGTALLSFARDPAGRITTVTDADNNVTTIERQTNGTPTGILAPFGQHTALTTDANGYLASVANPAGEIVRLFSKTNGLLDSLVDPRGKAHRFTYSAQGQLRRDDDPAGGFSTLALRQGTTTDTVDLATALGRKTRYRTERLANGDTRQIVTDPAGLVSTTTVGADGGSSIDAADGTTSSVSVSGDPRYGMQVPVVKSATARLPSGLTSTVTAARRATLSDPANPFSLLTQLDSIRVNGQVFTSTYDAATRRTTSTTPEGRQSIARSDTQGRIVSKRVVGLDSVSYQYDSQGRISQMRSGGRAWAYNYDVRGRLLSTLDPLGRRDSLFYDDADRLTRRVLPGGREVAFAYDSSGNVTAVTPPNRPAHGFGYTTVDLTSGYTPPNVGLTTPATTYQYNADRQLTQITRPDTVAVEFGYDTAGRPSTITFDRGQLAYGYSSTTGNLTSITAPGSNTLSYTYDGSLPKTVTWAGAVEGSVGVGYNTDFRVTSMTVNGASSLTFAYDGDGLLTTAGALGIKRHPQHGLPDRDSVGTVQASWSYTPRAVLSGYSASSGGSALFEAAYVRDSLDRITQLTETVQGTTAVLGFAYDSAGRLEEVRRDGVVAATYEYDANGSRTQLTTPGGTVTGTYDAQDRLTTYGATSYTYRSNGELKTKTDAGGTTGYTYDALGNLTAVTLPDATQITYIIDGQSRRVGKRVNGVLVQGFLYQGQLSPVAELNGSQQVVSRFVYGTRGNVPDYMIKDGVTYRLVTDHLGSVRLVVNTSDGTLAQRLDYDEFGRVTQNTVPGFQPFGFAGGLFDDRTGLLRFGARDYDPMAGRWMAKDPIGFQSGQANFYLYAFGDPVNLLDPTGLKVYVGQHPAFLNVSGNPFNHVTIVLRPDNPSDFADHPLFKGSGGTEATLGGQAFGPGSNGQVFGNLQSAPNYPGDNPNNLSDLTEVCRPAGMSDTDFIKALIEAADAYGNDLPYAPFPAKGTGYHNSNGYVAGVISAAGGIAPALPGRQPGYGNPVPILR